MSTTRFLTLLSIAFLLISGCSSEPTDSVDVFETGVAIVTPEEHVEDTPSPPDTMETQVLVLPLVESGDMQNNSSEVDNGGNMQGSATINVADVISVDVSGNEGAYQFSIGISSPDTGCDQYADWWEVITVDGELIYRRILLHSHVNEQPFVRSGGPVSIAPDTEVIVRAHMNTGGYGGSAFRGTVLSGFGEVELAPNFAANLSETPPLPDGCAF
jgi:hypothetical protein